MSTCYKLRERKHRLSSTLYCGMVLVYFTACVTNKLPIFSRKEKDDDIEKQVYYILENPVRKGLVNNWKEYPFKGSTIYNFEKW